MKNAINPDHYKSECSLECYQAMILALGVEGFINFCLGNAFKYMWRYKNKGKPKEDLEKANWYINKVIEYGDENDNVQTKAREMKDLLASLSSITLNSSDVKETDEDEKDWKIIYSILRDYIEYHCDIAFTPTELYCALETAERHCGCDS